MHVSTQLNFVKRTYVFRSNLYFLKECMFWAKFWKWIHRMMGSGRKFWRWIFRIHQLDLSIARTILKIHLQNFRPDPVDPLPEQGPEHTFFYRIFSYDTYFLYTEFIVSKHAFLFHEWFQSKNILSFKYFYLLETCFSLSATELKKHIHSFSKI